MAITRFELTNEWDLAAPIGRVWELIAATEEWPNWWRAVVRVEPLKLGAADGLGAVYRMHWKTALPYALSFDVETVRVEQHRAIEGRACGELDGTGLWTFRETERGTCARYVWRVDVTKPWMRAMAPVLRPVFTWNHHKVMDWGEQGARRVLELS